MRSQWKTARIGLAIGLALLALHPFLSEAQNIGRDAQVPQSTTPRDWQVLAHGVASELDVLGMQWGASPQVRAADVPTRSQEFLRTFRLVLAQGGRPLPTLARSLTATNASDQVRLLSDNQLRVAQRRECSQRVGPFATQDRAWQQWRGARSRGYAVSNGVTPCYDASGTRGYCFHVFFPC